MARFGYFVPEFPGQTHAFFWRELRALKDMGHEPEPVSTRRPRQSGLVPEWALNELPATHYLTPPNFASLRGTAGLSLHAALQPRQWSAVSGLPGLRPDSGRAPTASRAGFTARSRALEAARTVGLLWAGVELVRQARARQWTHVHVHSCADAAQVALFAHVLSGIPYSLTLHGPLSDYGPNQSDKWRNAKFCVVITDQLLAQARECLEAQLPPEVIVAPMGVELDSFTRASSYIPWTNEHQARIFSCGRLNPSKGHLDLIRALRTIVDSGVDAVLTIAGEDEFCGKGYRTVLQKAITELGLTERVQLLGAIPENRVQAELERTHVFALASHQEPLGVAIMEAMAMRVPVVATSAGGVPELVADGHNGRLVEPGQPPQLANAILEILRSPAMASAMGAQGRFRLESTFDVRRSASVLSELM